MIDAVLSHCVPQDGLTALIRASLEGYPDVVRVLLSAGAQVDLQNEVRHNISKQPLTVKSLHIPEATLYSVM